jgi:hypothetical protein
MVHLAGGREALAASVSTEHIRAGICRIAQQTQHSAMVQATPPQLPVPNSAVAALGEKQLVLGKVLNHSISAGGLSEGSEDQAHGPLHLLVWI